MRTIPQGVHHAKKKTGGRLKGTPNKLSATVKENIHAVFNRLEGTAGMAKWAKSNPTPFYQIYSKLLPSEVEQTTEHSGAIKQIVEVHVIDPKDKG